MSNRVLLVDGDPRNLRVLDVSLRRAGLNVETATSGTEAWEILERATPDLVIAATDLAGLDGFELCARLRQTEVGASTPVILLAADKSLDQKMRSLEAGADECLVKPVYVKEVVARAGAVLQRRDRERLTAPPDSPAREVADGGDRFAGSISDITVVDLVQVIEGNGRSGIVHLRSALGAPASIYFRQGRIVDAEVGRLSGTDALSRLFSWSEGSFDFEWKSIRRKDAIGRPSSELVIEGMQRLDEWNRLIAQLPDPNAIFEVDYRLLAERLAEIPDEVNEILRLCDGVRTLMQVVEDCPLPDVAALTALIRLREEGIVCDVSRRSSAPPARPARFDGWLGAGSSPFPSRLAPRTETGRIAIGMGSGPVQKSFADRLEGQDQDGAPSLSASMTGGLAAQPDLETDASAVTTPRRRTAPGLGEAVPGAQAAETPVSTGVSPREGAISEVRPTQHNVIKFPTNPEPRAVSNFPAAAAETASAPVELWSVETPSVARPADDLSPIRPGSDARVVDRSGSTLVSSPLAAASFADAPTPTRPPAPMSTTHRGFGPPSAVELRADSAVPDEVPDRSSSGAARDSKRVNSAESGRQVGEVREVREVRPARETTRETIRETWDAREGPATRDSRVGHVTSGLSEETARVSFSDHDISHGDALDELGLPSRWRGLRFLAVALVVGGLLAFGVRRFRIGATDHPTVPVTVPATVPAAMPDPVRVASSPPSSPSVEQSAPHAAAVPAGAVGASAPPAAAATPPPATGTASATVPRPSEAAERLPPAADPAAAQAPARAEALPRPGAVVPGAVGTAAETAPAVPTPAAARTGAAAPEPSAPPPGATTTPGRTADFPRQLAACRAAFMRGRMKDALTACATAVATNPGSAEALTMLAHAELNRGRLNEANALASRAVAINPNLADAYVIIGGVHQDSGQNREAKAAYRRYLQLAPQGRYADELRSIVNSL